MLKYFGLTDQLVQSFICRMRKETAREESLMQAACKRDAELNEAMWNLNPDRSAL